MGGDGEQEMVGIRMPDQLYDRFVEWTEERGVKKSEAGRRLIEAGLDALDGELQEEREERIRLEERVQSLEQERDRLSRECSEARDEIEETERVLEAEREELTEEREKRIRMESRVDELESTVDELENELKEAEDEAQKWRARYNEVSGKLKVHHSETGAVDRVKKWLIG